MDDNLFELHKMVLAKNLSVGNTKRLFNELRKTIPGEQNRWNFRWIVWTLALVALSVPVWFAYALHANIGDSKIPDGLLSLASAAVGALAAFVSPHTQAERGSNTLSTLSTLGAKDSSPSSQ